MVTPLTYADIYDVMQEDGVDEATTLGLLAVFGMGVTVHEEKRQP